MLPAFHVDAAHAALRRFDAAIAAIIFRRRYAFAAFRFSFAAYFRHYAAR